MPDLPMQLFRSCRSAAFAAAVFVMGASVVVDAGHAASAQGRLEAEYTATLAGIPIGRGNWIIDISDNQFSAAATGATTGLLRVFTGGHGTSSAHGIVNIGQPVPVSYAASISNDKRSDDVRMAFVGGNIKDLSVEPPPGPSPDRIPVTDADRHNVLDPMTSVLIAVGGSGDPVSPQACARKVAVFDGRMRYDLRSEFKRMETVKAEKGYQGPVVVCCGLFHPDFRLRAAALRDQIPYRVARRRNLAGADCRYAGDGAVPLLVTDADRHRRAPSDPIRHSRQVAACSGERQDAVNVARQLCWMRHTPSGPHYPQPLLS